MIMTHIRLNNLNLTMPVLIGSHLNSSDGVDPRIHYINGKAKSFAVLTDINLSLEAGDRLGVVGSNGAGKTTLLRVITGIYRPSFGDVHVKGTVESLFQVGLGMRDDRSGWDNLVLRGKLIGLKGPALRDYVRNCAAFAEIGTFIDMPMRTYSQGMAMRLMFAASTEAVPDILVLDELIGAGDASFRRRATERMLSLVDRSGIVVLSSHATPIVRSVCNKVLWLDRGRVREFGPTDVIIDSYAKAMKEAQTGKVAAVPRTAKPGSSAAA